MEIKVHNDGKGKYRSVECYIDVDGDIRGCGSNNDEAFTDMTKELKHYIDNLNVLYEKLQSGEVELISVDCFGKKLNRTPPPPPPGREIREWEVPK